MKKVFNKFSVIKQTFLALPQKKIEIISIISFLLVAFFIRIYQLGLYPLNYSEINSSLVAIKVFQKYLGLPVPFIFKPDIDLLSVYCLFWSEKIFLDPVLMIRFSSVLIGTITVFLIYLVGRKFYSREIGLMAAILWVFFPWQVIISRLGTEDVLIPFFNLLLILTFFIGVYEQNIKWFWGFVLAFFVRLFFISETSFLVVFTYSVLCFFSGKKILQIFPLKKWRAVLFTFILLSFIYFLYLQLKYKFYIYFLDKIDYLYYTKNWSWEILDTRFLLKRLVFNLRENILISFQGLFFLAKDFFRCSPSWKYPLFIHVGSLFFMGYSLFFVAVRRKFQDKMLLVILGIGFLVGVWGLERFYFKYILFIVPTLIIFLVYGISLLGNLIKNKMLSFLIKSLCLSFFIGLSLLQLRYYYIQAPTDELECVGNGYGCREAAEYLASLPDIKEARIIESERMTVNKYVNWFQEGKFLSKRSIRQKDIIYFVFWAPETHEEIKFKNNINLFHVFENHYRKQAPIKTIFYPNGKPAIHIYKVEKRERINQLNISEETDPSLKYYYIKGSMLKDYYIYAKKNQKKGHKEIGEEELKKEIKQAQDGRNNMSMVSGDVSLKSIILKSLNIEYLMEEFNTRPLKVITTQEEKEEDYIEKRLLFKDEHIGTFQVLMLMPEEREAKLPAIIGVHGHGDSSYVFKKNFMGRELVKEGFVVLLPSIRGTWASEEDSLYFLLKGYPLLGLEVYELLLVVKYLNHLEEVNPLRIGMIGHSGGSVLANLVARVTGQVSALVSDEESSFLNFDVAYPDCLGDDTVPKLSYYGFNIYDVKSLNFPLMKVPYGFKRWRRAIIDFFNTHLKDS